MKRSDVNKIIKNAMRVLEEKNFYLPQWAHWKWEKWKSQKELCHNIFETKLGWDVFSGDDFATLGAVLFTIRNGSVKDTMRPYCEKIILMEKGQVLPYHYHKIKTEDIINRGGGKIAFLIGMVDEQGNKLNKDITVSIDGIEKVVKQEKEFTIEPGESLTLYPYCYHRFGPIQNDESMLIGEVSKINDDETDNYFLEEVKRYPDVEEDEEILYPTVSDYNKLQI